MVFVGLGGKPQELFSPQETWFFLVDENGRIIRDPMLMLRPEWMMITPEVREVYQVLLHLFCLSAFYSLNLLNSMSWQLTKQMTPAGLGLGQTAGSLTHYYKLKPATLQKFTHSH